ncbi:unnamed protein product [Owenia fusiformis]|uniref:Uncharacterized protein n=1 Tax=Owenia fusiformis TaxID=6347 RepID=A0A8J1U2U4_OWEFU|nr:unnamed protein product [Owenia fusiformis]
MYVVSRIREWMEGRALSGVNPNISSTPWPSTTSQQPSGLQEKWPAQQTGVLQVDVLDSTSMQISIQQHTVMMLLLVSILHQGAIAKHKRKCGVCDKKQCTLYSGGPDNCPGELIWDKCRCCKKCRIVKDKMTSEQIQQEQDMMLRPDILENPPSIHNHPVMHKANDTVKQTKCQSIKCGSGKVCMLNIQGLPVCRCLPVISCSKRRKEVCGHDGKTYRTRCHLKIAECNLSKKIKVAYKGGCMEPQSHAARQMGEHPPSGSRTTHTRPIYARPDRLKQNNNKKKMKLKRKKAKIESRLEKMRNRNKNGKGMKNRKKKRFIWNGIIVNIP